MVSITQFERSVTESNVCFLWGFCGDVGLIDDAFHTLYTFVYIYIFLGGWGEEGVEEKNIPNRTTTISMFLYIKLARQNTSTIDIIFKPFLGDNSLLGNPICKTVSIVYVEIDQKIV